MTLIGDDIDYKELNRLVAPAKRILKGYDFIRLKKADEYDRMEMWNRIEESRKQFEEDFVSELEDDLVQGSSSKFSLASLLLAAAADTNHEESPIEYFDLPIFTRQSKLKTDSISLVSCTNTRSSSNFLLSLSFFHSNP
ncbi:MAG: hypothetical protein EMLJLAPB_00515 [Candidatus Argoarchaeum ethanivorans]|uniref:Uncharacterized protein n=1 Tax=Candidatus Argoarchaeum ethanivorans TaxID=2608793 RepID=A0A811TCX3_9EURY|nr:MAG: hypothetical protein EMLJLAPB_00489 [Candidatus Argoarchaeum ethanivorans]CAD6493379.1 MAG: hypothetical protein EMLJLAPB_00515 [Candidatus Argoarchaeum ethanivorans]